MTTKLVCVCDGCAKREELDSSSPHYWGTRSALPSGWARVQLLQSFAPKAPPHPRDLLAMLAEGGDPKEMAKKLGDAIDEAGMDMVPLDRQAEATLCEHCAKELVFRIGQRDLELVEETSQPGMVGVPMPMARRRRVG